MELELAILVSVVPTAINFCGVELTKKMQINLEEETKRKIKEEGLYHLTSKEAALSIMKSGYIKPSKGILNNHGAKSFSSNKSGELVYMFAGKPNLFSLAKNMAHSFGDKSDGTFYAIKLFPSDDEINKYKQRVNDGAITYDGQLQLNKCKSEIVRMKLEKGKLVEIPMDDNIKINPIKKRVLKRAGYTGLIISSAQQLFCDTLKFTVLPKNRAKVKQYIYERILVNKMLEQKKLEQEELNIVPKRYSIINSVKKWVNDRTVALLFEKSQNNINDLGRDEISKIKE